MLFNALSSKFLDYQRDVIGNSAGEMNQKEMCLRNHLLPYFGEQTFDAISRQDIERYIARKRKDKLATATIRSHCIILRRYMGYAYELKYLEQMPPIRLPKLPRKDEQNYLVPDELRQLYRAADKHRKPMWRLMIMFAANTGLRIGELLALDWRDLDRKNKKVYVRRSYCRKSRNSKSTKSGSPRYMYLTEQAASAVELLASLSGYPAEGLVFPVSYDAAMRAMASITKEAQIAKHVTWHTLRHTFATALCSMGQPIYVVAKLLGHASVSMAERYAHLTRDRSFAAIRDLDGVL